VGPCYTLTLASRSPDAIGCRYKVLHALSAAMFRAVHRTKSYMKFGFNSFVSDSADQNERRQGRTELPFGQRAFPVSVVSSLRHVAPISPFPNCHTFQLRLGGFCWAAVSRVPKCCGVRRRAARVVASCSSHSSSARFYREHRSTLLAGIGSLGKDELDVSQRLEFHIFCCNG
jgi:hypothetical protein